MIRHPKSERYDPQMPIPEQVRSRRFYFTAEDLPEEARTMLAKMLTVQLQLEYGDAP